MTDNYDDVAVDDTSSPYQYGKKSSGPFPRFKYKVWNPNPQHLTDDPTPGIVIRKTITNPDKSKDVSFDHVDKVRAVILFSTPGRKLGRGSGAVYRTVCESCDGESPSLRVKEPLCRKVETDDLVQIFSQWKGYDKAKVDAQIADVTDGTGKLQICGLKSRGGFINLCKYAKKDPDTGTPGACKQNLLLVGYDLDANHEFSMELTGRSITYGKFIAPIHEFFQFLSQGGPEGKSLPSYAFSVDLVALPNGQYYLLGVSNWQKLEDAELRNQMRDKALRVKEYYEKRANYIPTEAVNNTSPEAQNVTKQEGFAPVKVDVAVAAINKETQVKTATVEEAITASNREVRAAKITPAMHPVQAPVLPVRVEPKEISFDDDEIPF